MFRHAAAKFRKGEAVQWMQADACSLPFGDRMFDAVVCQFGIMFVPDKALAAREAHRVLKPGGLFLFNVWDAMEHNELGQLTHQTIASYFDKDPPAFYEVPFGYMIRTIKRALKEMAFKRSRPKSSPKSVQQARRKTQPQAWCRGIRCSGDARRPSLLGHQRPWLKDHNRFGGNGHSCPMRAIVVRLDVKFAAS
jgi:ubiquinone/menaquinone biosynthesis C-methylase UbiE